MKPNYALILKELLKSVHVGPDWMQSTKLYIEEYRTVTMSGARQSGRTAFIMRQLAKQPKAIAIFPSHAVLSLAVTMTGVDPALSKQMHCVLEGSKIPEDVLVNVDFIYIDNDCSLVREYAQYQDLFTRINTHCSRDVVVVRT